MIKFLVFCLVVGSTWRHTECNSKNLSNTLEKSTSDKEEPSKIHIKGHQIRQETFEDTKTKTESLANVLNNSRESTDAEKIKREESTIADANFVTPELPYSFVTMDAKSRNKTAALIRMVNQASVVDPKPSEAKPSHVVSPAKLEPSNGKVLDVLRRLNSVVNNYQPVYSQKGDLRKNERRYVITNYDVIESYIKSRRTQKEPSSDENRNGPIRRSDKADEADQTSESSSSGDESKKQSKDYGAAKNEDKLNYDDKSDDYIFSTKRNAWDYEHENWADVRTVNWDDVHSSKDNSGEDQIAKVKNDNLKITAENKEKVDKDVAANKNDRETIDQVVKEATTLKSKSRSNIADIRRPGETAKENSKYLEEHDSHIDETIKISEKLNIKGSKKSGNVNLKLNKNIKEQRRQDTRQNVDIGNRYRADRSNKSPNLNKADNWQKNNYNDELNDPQVNIKASEETYKTPKRREKTDYNEYNEKNIEEKSKLSDRPNQRIYKNSKEIKNNNDKYFKELTNDYTDDVQKKTGKKESYKDSYKDNNKDYDDEVQKQTGKKESYKDSYRDNDKDYADDVQKRSGKKESYKDDNKDYNDEVQKKSGKKESYKDSYKDNNKDYTDDVQKKTEKKDSYKNNEKDYADDVQKRSEKKDSYKDSYKDNEKDYADDVQKRSEKKESYKNNDYKDSYDYRDKKKKNQDYNDKKQDDDYKVTKKRSSDYKDYYGGGEDKKPAKNQDYNDKKFRNDYKNTEYKDYTDSNKKHDKNLDYGDKNVGDDYKNTKDKNTDHNMDNDKPDKKEKDDWIAKSKYNDPDERNDNNDDSKNKKSNTDDWDTPLDSREKKSSDKANNKNKKEELDYKDTDTKKKKDSYNAHANNDWDNVGVEKKNSDKSEKNARASNDWDSVGKEKKNADDDITTRRTTKRYIDDYDKPRQPKHYDEVEITTRYKYVPPKRSDRNDNNNWGRVAVSKRQRDDYDSYNARPRKNKKGRSGGFNSRVGTHLPMRERKSVYESD